MICYSILDQIIQFEVSGRNTPRQNRGTLVGSSSLYRDTGRELPYPSVKESKMSRHCIGLQGLYFRQRGRKVEKRDYEVDGLRLKFLRRLS